MAGYRSPMERVEIPGDTLLLDKLFHQEVLGGASRRTGKRLEAEGLPFLIIRGYKYRPLQEGRVWLASRMQRRNQSKQKKRLAV